MLTGKMSELLIFSQNVSCEKIIKEGFRYEFKDLNSALEDLLK
jgi:NAD dependent epimerase/dehydratase family enzyme